MVCVDIGCSAICNCCFFFFKQKTAYEMRISDWSSDVCSSDLGIGRAARLQDVQVIVALFRAARQDRLREIRGRRDAIRLLRSEEHTSELQSLMRISYAVFCSKKKNEHDHPCTTAPQHHPHHRPSLQTNTPTYHTTPTPHT